jgi:hypothetical protein
MPKYAHRWKVFFATPRPLWGGAVWLFLLCAVPNPASAVPETAVPGSFRSPPSVQFQWPAGSGRALVETRCLFCHHAELIVAQRLTPAQWSKEVKKMVKWGAPLDPSEQKVLAAYLAQHFGPTRRPYAPTIGNLEPLTP